MRVTVVPVGVRFFVRVEDVLWIKDILGIAE